MNINKIDHLCIAVKDLEEAKQRWAPILGTEPDDEYVHEGEQIRVARYILGGVGFELMESTSSEGDVAKWIDKRGEGLMLVSLNVDSTRQAVQELEQQDFPIVGGLRKFRDCEFAFVHPKAVNGVLLELIDDKWAGNAEGE